MKIKLKVSNVFITIQNAFVVGDSVSSFSVTSKLKQMFIIIIGIQPVGRSGQRPELSHATGMALVRYILGKFLGVVCHCFPPRLDVPTFATRYLHVRHNARDLSGGRWDCGRECCPVILPK